MLMAQHRSDRLVELLEAARKAAPGNAAFTVVLAELFANNGDVPRGYALLNQMPKDQTELPGVLAERARLQIALGQQREAQNTYRRILTADPRNLDAVRRLAELLMQAGDTVGAKQVIRPGVGRDAGQHAAAGGLRGSRLPRWWPQRGAGIRYTAGQGASPASRSPHAQGQHIHVVEALRRRRRRLSGRVER